MTDLITHEALPEYRLTDMVVNNLHNIKKSDVRNIIVKIDSKTGMEELEVNLADGRTIIQKNFPSGISEKSVVNVPKFDSVQERNDAARELKKSKKTQVEIARILNCSQTTVCKALKGR